MGPVAGCDWGWIVPPGEEDAELIEVPQPAKASMSNGAIAGAIPSTCLWPDIRISRFPRICRIVFTVAEAYHVFTRHSMELLAWRSEYSRTGYLRSITYHRPTAVQRLASLSMVEAFAWLRLRNHGPPAERLHL